MPVMARVTRRMNLPTGDLRLLYSYMYWYIRRTAMAASRSSATIVSARSTAIVSKGSRNISSRYTAPPAASLRISRMYCDVPP